MVSFTSTYNLQQYTDTTHANMVWDKSTDEATYGGSITCIVVPATESQLAQPANKMPVGC